MLCMYILCLKYTNLFIGWRDVYNRICTKRISGEERNLFCYSRSGASFRKKVFVLKHRISDAWNFSVSCVRHSPHRALFHELRIKSIMKIFQIRNLKILT